MPNWKKILVSGSDASLNTLVVSNGITGSLLGTASFAISSSRAVTASFALTSSYAINPTISGSINNVNYIDFNTSYTATQPVAGRLSWNNSDGTLDLGMKGGNVTQQIGEEIFYEVRNETGTPIANGTLLYANGVTAGSGRITAAPFTADGSVREVRLLGMATENISNGVNGFVTHFGYVRDLDTRGNVPSSIAVGDETWAVGDILYAHPTVAGKLTNVRPKHEIIIAIIIVRHQSTGVVFTRPSSYGHLDDIHDVYINTGSLSTGDLLIYNSGSDYWTNSKQLSGSYGLTGSLNVTAGITGSLLGTSSYATSALSSSFATTASFAISSSRAVTSSFAITASYVTGSIYTSTNPALSASFASIALSSSFATTSISSSFATTASFAISSSRAITSSFASTASFVANSLITASVSSNTITFTKGNGTTFPITVATGSAAPAFPFTGSAGITGSLTVVGPISASAVYISGSAPQRLVVIGSGSASPIFTVQGSQGELFSVTDSLSGSLFSVNDISGLPIMEVFSDNTILMGDYQDPMLLTTKKVTQTNSGSFTIYSIPTASYDGAFIDYTIKSGSNARAGTIMSTWAGSSIEFTEVDTMDIGSTTAVGLTMILSGSNAVMTGASSTGAWTIRTIIRAV